MNVNKSKVTFLYLFCSVKHYASKVIELKAKQISVFNELECNLHKTKSQIDQCRDFLSNTNSVFGDCFNLSKAITERANNRQNAASALQGTFDESKNELQILEEKKKTEETKLERLKEVSHRPYSAINMQIRTSVYMNSNIFIEKCDYVYIYVYRLDAFGMIFHK